MCVVDYVASADIGWGIAKYTWYLLKHLKEIAKEEGIEIVEISHGLVPQNFLRRELRKLLFINKIRRHRAHLYHAISPTLALPLLALGRRPCIVTVHDLNFLYHERKQVQLLSEFAYHKYVCEKCDDIIVIGNFWKDVLTRKMGITRKKIHVVYHGVDHDRFKPLPLKINKNEKRILFVRVRTHLPIKRRGIKLVLKAFKIVNDEIKNVKLLLLGKVDDTYVNALVRKFGIDKSRVKLLGFISEEKLPITYNMCDVIVNPPFDEFSLMILEGMACGVPIIASKHFEIPEYVDDAGILIDRMNVERLAEAILKVLTDDNLRESLIKKSLNRSRLFNWKKCAFNTFKIYEKHF